MKSLKIIIVTFIALTWSLQSQAVAEAPILTKQIKILQSPKVYAKLSLHQYGWKLEEYVCLNHIWTKESNWNPKSDNPTSTAFGIAQMLNEKSKNPIRQIDNGLRYIKERYGQPCAAWKFWQKHYWY